LYCFYCPNITKLIKKCLRTLFAYIVYTAGLSVIEEETNVFVLYANKNTCRRECGTQ
jgi:hypothetical protein